MNKMQTIFGALVGIAAVLGLFGLVQYPHYIQIPFVTIFMAIWLFTGGIHAKQMLKKGLMDSFLLWAYSPLVMAVLLLDVIFNVFYGSLIFREAPREWLFTQRVQRHMHDKDNHVARLWERRLNYIDPGHV